VIYKCAGVEITPDALKRVSLAALEWSEREDLTRGQQTMARALSQQAARLAEAPAMTGKEVALVKKLCCQLFSAVNDGAKPGPSQWPCGPRSGSTSIN
jgi:hypothetical protein